MRCCNDTPIITFMMIVGILVLILVELPLAISLAVFQGLRQRPIVQKCYACFIELICEITANILENKRVQKAAGNVIAEGMNTFLMETSRIEQHMKNMAETMSKAQPEFARKQGEDFPVVVGSFLQGILRGVGGGKRKINDAASKDGSVAALSKDEIIFEQKEETKELEEETKEQPIVINSSGSDSEADVASQTSSKRRMIIHLGSFHNEASSLDVPPANDTASVRSALSGSEHNVLMDHQDAF